MDQANSNPPPYSEKPPPPYVGEPVVNYPNHAQVPPPAGWGAMPPPPPPYQYGATTTTVTVQPGLPNQHQMNGPNTRVVIIGNGCPSCRMGMLVDSYDCLALFLAIFFFPLGILCCLAMREKRCTNCGASF